MKIICKWASLKNRRSVNLNETKWFYQAFIRGIKVKLSKTLIDLLDRKQINKNFL